MKADQIGLPWRVVPVAPPRYAGWLDDLAADVRRRLQAGTPPRVGNNSKDAEKLDPPGVRRVLKLDTTARAASARCAREPEIRQRAQVLRVRLAARSRARASVCKGTDAEDTSGHEVTAEDKLGDDEVSAAERVAPPGTSWRGDSIGPAQAAFAARAANWRSKVEDAVRLIDDGDVAATRAALADLLGGK